MYVDKPIHVTVKLQERFNILMVR